MALSMIVASPRAERPVSNPTSIVILDSGTELVGVEHQRFVHLSGKRACGSISSLFDLDKL
eukprot:6173895-Pleurochrysis_carterae.AAC.5